jgi:hypothetical protein
MSDMLHIAVLGDLHGHFTLAYRVLKRWEREHSLTLDLVLQVGDLGAFPPPFRLDKATKRFAEHDSDELGFAVYHAGEAEAEEVLGAEAPETLRVEYWAQAIEHRALDSFDQVRALNGQHIWREEILADRFQWGREQSIYAILVRVHRLPLKLELPMLPDYAGCKSWVTLAHTAPFTPDPVLDDPTFQSRLTQFHSSLFS